MINMAFFLRKPVGVDKASHGFKGKMSFTSGTKARYISHFSKALQMIVRTDDKMIHRAVALPRAEDGFYWITQKHCIKTVSERETSKTFQSLYYKSYNIPSGNMFYNL